jgi:hypothetical protein
VKAAFLKESDTSIRSGKGFYEYLVDFMQEEQDKRIKKRGREFLDQLKNLYLNKSVNKEGQ